MEPRQPSQPPIKGRAAKRSETLRTPLTKAVSPKTVSPKTVSTTVSKAERQHRIGELIGQHPVTNQSHLVQLLQADGVLATQATVSRDLEELGAVKVRQPGGEAVYAIPEFAPDRIAPWDQLRRVLGEWVAEVEHSGNLVVVRTPPGCAHVVASALDRSRFPGLLGTVAGDDTLLCIATQSTGGKALAVELRTMAGRAAPSAKRAK
jgi:transcriptional regulator of arginine metabolism